MTTDQVTIENVNGNYYITKQSDLGTMFLSSMDCIEWTNRMTRAFCFPTEERASEVREELFANLLN
jgi:hypothetical protein